MKDNTNHTAAIFFTVMLFLAVMTSIWYWYYKKNGGTATISGGLHAFSSSCVKKNLFQNSRDARPRAQRFQAFADDDGDSNNEFVMADSPSPYEAPTSLRENYASKEHHHQGNGRGAEQQCSGRGGRFSFAARDQPVRKLLINNTRRAL